METLQPNDWQAKDEKRLMFLLAHPVPRPYSVFRQIGEDLTAWEVYRFYGFPLAMVIVAMVLGWWIAACVVMATLVVFHSHLMTGTIRMFRHDRLEKGFVTHGEPHVLSNQPVFKDWTAATATLESGQSVPVTFDDPRARQLLDRGRRLEVLVLISSNPLTAKNASHMVAGFRPAINQAASPNLTAT